MLLAPSPAELLRRKHRVAAQRPPNSPPRQTPTAFYCAGKYGESFLMRPQLFHACAGGSPASTVALPYCSCAPSLIVHYSLPHDVGHQNTAKRRRFYVVLFPFESVRVDRGNACWPPFSVAGGAFSVSPSFPPPLPELRGGVGKRFRRPYSAVCLPPRTRTHQRQGSRPSSGAAVNRRPKHRCSPACLFGGRFF